MKTKTLILSFAALIVVVTIGYGFYWFGMTQGMKMAAPAAGSAVAEAGGTGAAAGSTGAEKDRKKVLYWHDPMVPGPRFDKPGKSPFMDMDLVPVYAEGEGDEGTVRISPRVQQNLGIRTAMVEKGSVKPSVQAVGNVVYNERDLAVVTARSNGYVEKLYVRAVLDPVRRGQPLAEVYVPEWIAVQEDYRTVKQMDSALGGELLESARQRMRLAGMTEEHIRQVERSGKVIPRMTLRAPINGVISELSTREGMTVMSGAPLFRINGMDTVWVEAELPESLAGQVRPGDPIEAKSRLLNGASLTGKVNAILPEINAVTRTLKARIELDNPGQRLVPGMFVTVNFLTQEKSDVLFIPTEAVIQTGNRSVVIAIQGEGKFAPVDVRIGMESGGNTVIHEGLEEGQKVVVSGQFLIDSEASLKGMANRMGETPVEQSKDTTPDLHRGEGKVEDIAEDEIIISHGPIPSLKWGR